MLKVGGRLKLPRFFFHLEDSPDDLGMELPSLSAAKCEAVRYAGRLICDEAATFWGTADFHMWVEDAAGLILFSLRFSGIEAPAVRRF